MSGSLDTSDILVVIDKGSSVNVNLQPPDQYGISIKSGDTYVVNVDLPSIIVTDGSDSYNTVSDFALNALSASYALTASYVAGAASSWDTIANKPNGLVSSSTQVDYNQIQNKPTTSATASYVEYTNVVNKPSLVSSSIQISEYGIFATTGSNVFNGTQIISGGLTFSDNTTQTTAFTGIPSGVVSSSQQVVDSLDGQIITPSEVTASLQGTLTSNQINVSTNTAQFATVISSSLKSGIYAATEVIDPPISSIHFKGVSVEYNAQRIGGTRSGILLASWTNDSISYTDVSNTEIGDTEDLSFNFIRVGDDILLRAYSAGNGVGDWTVQFLFKMFPNLL